MAIDINTTKTKFLEYVVQTDSLMDKLREKQAAEEVITRKVAELIPAAVDALIKNELIYPNEKAAALDALKDPVKTLEVLINTINQKSAASKTTIGGPEKVAAANSVKNAYSSLNDNYVGRKNRPGKPESWKAFDRALGINNGE